jgi:hypothetical protein
MDKASEALLELKPVTFRYKEISQADSLMPRRREASTNALNFSGSVLIEAGNVIETHEHSGEFKEAL